MAICQEDLAGELAFAFRQVIEDVEAHTLAADSGSEQTACSVCNGVAIAACMRVEVPEDNKRVPAACTQIRQLRFRSRPWHAV